MITKIDKIKALFKVIRLVKNWPTYILEVLGLHKKRLITYTLRDGRILTMENGNGTGRRLLNEVFMYESYCPDKYLKIKKGDIVLDIGANVGTFSLYCNNAEKVYAFEPVPDNIQLLKYNIAQNPPSNIEIVEKAVSSKNGFQNIYVSKKAYGSHTLIENFQVDETTKALSIQTILLSDFIKEKKIKKINFLKMDCEGSEFEILYSLPKEDFKKIERISMEAHLFNKEVSLSELANYLRQNGYLVKVNDTGIYSTVYAIRRELLNL